MTDERGRTRQRGRHRAGQEGAGSNDAANSYSSGAEGAEQTPTAESAPVRRTGLFRNAVAVAAVASIAAGAFFGLAGGGDTISDQENQNRIAAHQTLLASSTGLPVKMVGADEVDDAIASMPDDVSVETREEIREQINQGRMQLAWVTLWDTHAEDGDILRFESSSSIPIDVMALNAKTTFAIPYPADGKVIVTGVKDGGGGITIALESGATSIAWPTMMPGDQLDLPVSPTY